MSFLHRNIINAESSPSQPVSPFLQIGLENNSSSSVNRPGRFSSPPTSPTFRRGSLISKSLFEGLPGFKRSSQEQFEYIPQKTKTKRYKKSVSSSKEIEEKSLNPSKSYKFFEEIILNPKSSGNRSRRKSTIYQITTDSKNHNLDESPYEKFQRLKHEVETFVSEMENLASSNKKLHSESTSYYRDMLKQSQQLEQQLNDLKERNHILPEVLSIDEKEPSASQVLLSAETVHQELGILFENQQNERPYTSNSLNALTKSSEEQDREDMSKILKLEKRLALLEKLVGNGDEPLPVDSTKISYSIEESRVKFISKELDSISSSENLGIGFNSEKVDRLYQKVRKWDELAMQVPMIVSRLQTLKIVHDEAIYFAGTVTKLKEQQEELMELLHGNADVLENFNQNFSENLAIINNNMKSLQERIRNLEKK
ncbi:hypothetical protein FDP41_013765 [Naegleria fowleri]|uniref:Uncharacterized protein n=1 Tax=Naegleria fowleri TaxID=5763 RepID=A0A6A5BXM9_NAEFO|nr:uncharacterized protein FDP41_013765 [Naegleria fowleri]KAF0980116.1 hypothetical protein FDP41_013765 [Naegleria fowleri]